MKICVVGAGIAGASCAVRLKKAYPEAELDLVAASFSPSTTSDGSGGFWQPHLLRDTPDDLVTKWSRETFQLCENLWRGHLGDEDIRGLEGLRTAVSLVPCYDLIRNLQQPPEENGWEAIVYEYKWMSQKEAQSLGFPRNTAGHSFLSYVYEPGLALPVFYEWLQQQPGVRLVERKLAKVDEVMHSYQLVVNCTGVGAKYFVDDSNITPISGQVLRVQAPWLHFVVASADDVYIIPNRDAVVVGSINKFNNWDTSVNDGDAELILERCADQLCPRLRDCKILDQWVGLRPFRLGGVRLEHELYKGTCHIVHNYGHGGCGVTLSWGCAKQVVEIAKSLFPNKPNKL